jgi:hypothetical protein
MYMQKKATILIVGIVLMMVSGCVSPDDQYLHSTPEQTCPGVPELTYWNTTYYTETVVLDGYGQINKQKTVERMKARCSELQAERGIIPGGDE